MYNDYEAQNKSKKETLQDVMRRTSSNNQHGKTDGYGYERSSVDNRLSAEHSWQYTSIDNAKVLYNAQDAKQYIQNMARTLEIGNFDKSSNFIQDMLRRVDQITRSTGEPLEYWYDGVHEKSYLLVLIEANENHIGIGYSYHLIADTLSQSNNSVGSTVLQEPKTRDWFRKRACNSLKIPVSIVSNLTTSNLSPTEYKGQRLSQPPEQQSKHQFSFDSQDDSSMEQNTGLRSNVSNNTMNYQPTSTVRTRQQERNEQQKHH